MGFIKAFSGALGGTLADQWKDFLMPPPALPPTAALFPGVPQGQNAGRGSNTKGSANIITNGSLIVVPEGYALVTFQDGELTGFIAEPGGYEYSSDNQNSKSMFAGDGLISPTVKTSWERFKFGGQPGAQQLVFYVNLKEIPNNRFGTQSEIYWDDAYLGAQVGAITRGSYTLNIVDPILFIKGFVPLTYYSYDAQIFDFTDMNNDAASQLFNEVVGSLAAAFSYYTNDPSKGNRIARIQGDAIGFAQSLSAAVEEGYQWTSARGITITKVAIQAIEYDEDTKALLSDVKKADALGGARGNSFMQQAAARGIQAAGENPGGAGGGAGMAFLGMGMQSAGGAMGGLQQPAAPPQYPPPAYPPQSQPPQGPPPQGGAPQGAPPQGPPPDPAAAQQPPAQQAPAEQPAQAAPAGGGDDDPVAKLAQYKSMLDQGLITQEDYDSAKAKVLGL